MPSRKGCDNQGPALSSARAFLLEVAVDGPGFGWRQMRADDLGAVEAIAGVVHPGFFEAPEVFAERLRLYPAGALLLEGAGRAQGYLISHPYAPEQVPALNALLGGLPAGADSYYLHDLAILPAMRGMRAAGAVIGMVMERAEAAGFSTASLVAVNGSRPFWERQGFVVMVVEGLGDKLAGYDAEACYMVRRFG